MLPISVLALAQDEGTLSLCASKGTHARIRPLHTAVAVVHRLLAS